MLVAPEISRAKLERELAEWDEKARAHRKRGMILLRRDAAELEVDVGFACPFPLAPGMPEFGLIALTIGLRFSDYDLKPPSLRFVNAFTGKPEPPLIEAHEDKSDGSGVIQIIQGHPKTQQPFFCAPGNREYHDHPQHSGDLWPLYRASGAGRLVTICERVWNATAGTIRGWHVGQTMAAPPLGPLGSAKLLQLSDGAMKHAEEQAAAAQSAAEQAAMRRAGLQQAVGHPPRAPR